MAVLIGGRYTGGLGIGLLMVSGCVRFNPAFEQAASASGGHSNTSAAGSSGSTTSGSATLDSGTTGAPKGQTTDEGATSTSSGWLLSSSGVVTSSSGIIEDGSGPTIPPDMGDQDLPTIVLYPSVLVGGDFASLGGAVDSAGPQECEESADEARLRLACDEVFPIVGWPAQPLGDLDDIYPALALAPLVNAVGEELASSFDALLAGTVVQEFAVLVMEPAGADDAARFWWGYSVAGDLHCGSWGLSELEGTTRLFANTGVTNEEAFCDQEYRLLCACIESPR